MQGKLKRELHQLKIRYLSKIAHRRSVSGNDNNADFKQVIFLSELIWWTSSKNQNNDRWIQRIIKRVANLNKQLDWVPLVI